ncbi:MAG: PaaI family thioesterase [Sedimentisphaerales bacterium]|nr:PaaI family thioesterase [Sedimentisphaerales bacterium]
MTKQPTSRTCFLCGRDNQSGLKMVWYNNNELNQVEADVTIPEHFNGYPGITHGGIVAAILDETAGRAVMLDGDFENLFITLRLNVTYRKPTPTNKPLKAIGWIEHSGRRSMNVAAKMLLPDGTICAECQAVVIRPTGEISESWEKEKKFWRADSAI